MLIFSEIKGWEKFHPFLKLKYMDICIFPLTDDSIDRVDEYYFLIQLVKYNK